MINKYEDGIIPTFKSGVNEADCELEDTASTVITNYQQLMDELHFSDALAEAWKLVAQTNKYIDQTEPWNLAKNPDDKEKLDSVMAHLAAGLRVIAELISPVMTHAPKEIFTQLGIKEDINLKNLRFEDVPAGAKCVAKGRQSSHGLKLMMKSTSSSSK